MVTIMIFEKHILYLVNVSNCLKQMRNDHVSNPFYKLTHNHKVDNQLNLKKIDDPFKRKLKKDQKWGK